MASRRDARSHGGSANVPPRVHLAAVLTWLLGEMMIYGAPGLMRELCVLLGRGAVTAADGNELLSQLCHRLCRLPSCSAPWRMRRSRAEGMRRSDGQDRGDEADNGSVVLLHRRGRATAMRERERSHTEGKRRHLKLNVRASIW